MKILYVLWCSCFMNSRVSWKDLIPSGPRSALPGPHIHMSTVQVMMHKLKPRHKEVQVKYTNSNNHGVLSGTGLVICSNRKPARTVDVPPHTQKLSVYSFNSAFLTSACLRDAWVTTSFLNRLSIDMLMQLPPKVTS